MEVWKNRNEQRIFSPHPFRLLTNSPKVFNCQNVNFLCHSWLVNRLSKVNGEAENKFEGLNLLRVSELILRPVALDPAPLVSLCFCYRFSFSRHRISTSSSVYPLKWLVLPNHSIDNLQERTNKPEKIKTFQFF